MIRCPFCHHTQSFNPNHDWDEFASFPIQCTECGEIFWSDGGDNEQMAINVRHTWTEEIPPLTEGTQIIVINRQIKFHLSPGEIIERDHKHYRVRIAYHDGQRSKHTILWMPDHWIKPIPGWLKKR